MHQTLPLVPSLSNAKADLPFFSRKLSDSERKYSAFDRELLVSYSAIKHFRHFLEGRSFTLYTDHKPLTSALISQTDRSPRQTRHLSFIAEFTSNIQHIKGKFNVVAHALSRITTVDTWEAAVDIPHSTVPDTLCIDQIDFDQLAEDQEKSGGMASYRTATTGLLLQDINIGSSKLLCDTSMGPPRPVLPTSWTRTVFDKIHWLSHSGVRPTQKAIAQRFVWNGMKRDIRKWCKECPDCQASKIHRHTRSPLTERLPPSDRFCSLHVDLVGPLPESQGMTYLFTIIDRFTRWPEAIPVPNAHTSTCASALLHHWVARFGVPVNITSDRGRQFTSVLWTSALKPTPRQLIIHKLMEWLSVFIDSSRHHSKLAQPALTGLMSFLWFCWVFVLLGESILAAHQPNSFMARHSVYPVNSCNHARHALSNLICLS
ncbi:hypothetical protein RRG08_034706 [Elysia crispata]|uniref:Integrase catalytic domain-containing protein n=1 Tax=Elysia crispata TaxID=231223 RepID=A0AAE0Z1B8_9GAST|nr:hypothetical protein RRG08_034706 [Elysia crispata]